MYKPSHPFSSLPYNRKHFNLIIYALRIQEHTQHKISWLSVVMVMACVVLYANMIMILSRLQCTLCKRRGSFIGILYCICNWLSCWIHVTFIYSFSYYWPQLYCLHSIDETSMEITIKPKSNITLHLTLSWPFHSHVLLLLLMLIKFKQDNTIRKR